MRARPPKRPAFARNTPEAPMEAPVETWEQQKAREARAYLDGQRALITQRIAAGNDPYTYLPTVEGEILGARLKWSDLTTAELRWIVLEQEEYLTKARGFPGGDPKGERDAMERLNPARAELAARGVAV